MSKETLKRSNFKYVKIGKSINIEKSLIHGQKVSGHYVQGHTDTTGKVVNIAILNKTWLMQFEIKKYFQKYLVEKGSIAINGVSLTISKIKNNGFEVNIIPHTLKLTNLIKFRKNEGSNSCRRIWNKDFRRNQIKAKTNDRDRRKANSLAHNE